MSEEFEIQKDGHRFVILETLTPSDEKNFHLRKEFKEGMGWPELIAKAIPSLYAIDPETIRALWPYNEIYTVLETNGGGLLVKMPFLKVLKLIDKQKVVKMTHSENEDE